MDEQHNGSTTLTDSPPVAAGDEAAPAADDVAAAVDEAPTGHSLVAKAGAATVLGAIAVAGTAGLLIAVAGRAGGSLALAPGESVLMSARPRKVVWRYLATLGLWEVSRRSTRFTVTDQRVVVEEGLLDRAAHSVPLSRISDVRVHSGVWQGFVDIASPLRSGSRRDSMGPLRTPVARAMAAAIARGMTSRP